MKLGMRLKSSIFALGACVALSGFSVGCGDDVEDDGATDSDGGAGEGGTGGKGTAGKGGTGGKAAAGKGGTGGKAAAGKGGTGGKGGAGGDTAEDAGAEDAG